MWRGEILCIRLEWDGVLYVDEWPSCREPLRLSPSSVICEKTLHCLLEILSTCLYLEISRDSQEKEDASLRRDH